MLCPITTLTVSTLTGLVTGVGKVLLSLALAFSALAPQAPEPGFVSGIYPGADRSLGYVEAFAGFRGRPVDVISVFPSRDTWESMAYDSSEIDRYGGFPGRLSVAVPLLPEREDATMRQVADGWYDQPFHAIASNLVSRGRGNSDIRLGWEFNGDWPWRAEDPAAFRAAFRRVAKIFRDTSPDFTINWNGNGLPSATPGDPFGDMYPGDDVVDIVGVDLYDFNPAATATPEAFAAWAARPQGLDDWFGFARAHQKKFAVPEWGSDGKHRNGDNPGYISGMHDFFVRNQAHLAYECYFGDPKARKNSLFKPNQLPRASRAYQMLWAGSDS